jgi:hypothetical protein
LNSQVTQNLNLSSSRRDKKVKFFKFIAKREDLDEFEGQKAQKVYYFYTSIGGQILAH